MDNKELTHWGVKGMRWGVRRYQNKDGSLTAAGKKRRDKEEAEEKESLEERRARVLKSTDANEIYKNRGILSTAEINERLSRLDAERRLGDAAAKNKKSGYEAVDKMLKFGRKVNEVYEFTNTPIMKALKKKLGVDKAEKALGLEEAYKMRDKLSTDELSKVLKRTNTEKAMKKIIDDDAPNKAGYDYYNDPDRFAKDYPGYGTDMYKNSYRFSGKTSVDSVPKETIDAGRSAVAGLLSAPKPAGLLPAPKTPGLSPAPKPAGLLPASQETRALGQSAIAGLLEEPK